ncbi:hypothetical protein J4219_02205 [Candidatus Woesearchaeota archaeon]|nr:hypothetical protein [Candidatus Woesearchaeota archaeon]
MALLTELAEKTADSKLHDAVFLAACAHGYYFASKQDRLRKTFLLNRDESSSDLERIATNKLMNVELGSFFALASVPAFFNLATQGSIEAKELSVYFLALLASYCGQQFYSVYLQFSVFCKRLDYDRKP